MKRPASGTARKPAAKQLEACAAEGTRAKAVEVDEKPALKKMRRPASNAHAEQHGPGADVDHKQKIK